MMLFVKLKILLKKIKIFKGDNMCNFCNNIPTLDDYTTKISPYDRHNTIVYNHHVNRYGLWIEIDDWYYSGIIKEIYYCPVCGRELNQNKNICSVEK